MSVLNEYVLVLVQAQILYCWYPLQNSLLIVVYVFHMSECNV